MCEKFTPTFPLHGCCVLLRPQHGYKWTIVHKFWRKHDMMWYPSMTSVDWSVSSYHSARLTKVRLSYSWRYIGFSGLQVENLQQESEDFKWLPNVEMLKMADWKKQKFAPDMAALWSNLVKREMTSLSSDGKTKVMWHLHSIVEGCWSTPIGRVVHISRSRAMLETSRFFFPIYLESNSCN